MELTMQIGAIRFHPQATEEDFVTGCGVWNIKGMQNHTIVVVTVVL